MATDTALHAQLRPRIDREEISDLLADYARALDQQPLDEAWAQRFYTQDAAVDFPVGRVTGRHLILARMREGMRAFARTVHLAGAPAVELDGDRARARGALLSTHVLAGGAEALFVSAGHLDTRLVRTEDGWRIAAQTLSITWTEGTPPAAAGGGASQRDEGARPSAGFSRRRSDAG